VVHKTHTHGFAAYFQLPSDEAPDVTMKSYNAGILTVSVFHCFQLRID